jgi:hypothetical protein
MPNLRKIFRFWLTSMQSSTDISAWALLFANYFSVKSLRLGCWCLIWEFFFQFYGLKAVSACFLKLFSLLRIRSDFVDFFQFFIFGFCLFSKILSLFGLILAQAVLFSCCCCCVNKVLSKKIKKKIFDKKVLFFSRKLFYAVRSLFSWISICFWSAFLAMRHYYSGFVCRCLL